MMALVQLAAALGTAAAASRGPVTRGPSGSYLESKYSSDDGGRTFYPGWAFAAHGKGGLGYPPLPEMHTTVIGGYSRKAQWRPRLVHAAWSLPGPNAETRDEPRQWSEAELKTLLHQVAVTPTSTHIIAAPAAPRARGAAR